MTTNAHGPEISFVIVPISMMESHSLKYYKRTGTVHTPFFS